MDTTLLLDLCVRDPCINRCFVGVFPSNKLPSKLSWPSCLIANTKPSNSQGEHWVAMFINKEGYGDYFCSYGQPPLPTFAKYLNSETTDWNYSQKTIQDYISTTCGQYAVFFLHARANGLPLSKFLSLFTSNKAENDEIVTAYINGLYNVDTKVFDVSLFQ